MTLCSHLRFLLKAVKNRLNAIVDWRVVAKKEEEYLWSLSTRAVESEQEPGNPAIVDGWIR